MPDANRYHEYTRDQQIEAATAAVEAVLLRIRENPGQAALALAEALAVYSVTMGVPPEALETMLGFAREAFRRHRARGTPPLVS